MKLDYKFLVTLITITAALTTAGYAKDRHAKTKSKTLKPLPPGPEWVDTNHDGQLSNDELKRATQILEQKMKEAQPGSANAAAPSGFALANLDQKGQLSDKAAEKAEADLKNQFGKYIEQGAKSSEQKVKSNKP